MMVADGLQAILPAYREPLSDEDGLRADGALTLLPPECRDGDHRGRAGVARSNPPLPVGPVAIVKPLLRLYEDMIADRRVSQFEQRKVWFVVGNEGAFESPFPLARISIPAQERVAVLVEFDPGEQVIGDPLDFLPVEAAERPLPQFPMDEVVEPAEALLGVAFAEVVGPSPDPAIEVADHDGDGIVISLGLPGPASAALLPRQLEPVDAFGAVVVDPPDRGFARGRQDVGGSLATRLLGPVVLDVKSEEVKTRAFT